MFSTDVEPKTLGSFIYKPVHYIGESKLHLRNYLPFYQKYFNPLLNIHDISNVVNEHVEKSGNLEVKF